MLKAWMVVLFLAGSVGARGAELPARGDVERLAAATALIAGGPGNALSFVSTAPVDVAGSVAPELPAVVVATARGMRYHKAGCRSAGTVAQATGRAEAEGRGLTPCRRCLSGKKERAPRARSRARGASGHGPDPERSPSPDRPWDSP